MTVKIVNDIVIADREHIQKCRVNKCLRDTFFLKFLPI